MQGDDASSDDSREYDVSNNAGGMSGNALLEEDDIGSVSSNTDTSTLQPHVYAEDYRPRISLLQIIIACAWVLGYSFCFQLQFIYGTPMMIEAGIDRFWTSFAWLCVPLCELVVEPSIGLISDYSTSCFGRRKPFMVLGAIISCFGLVIMANFVALANLVAPADLSTAQTVIIIISLWITNIGLSVLKCPSFALILDSCAKDQQKSGTSVYSFFLSGAAGVCGIIGFLDWNSLIHIPNDVHLPFYIGCVLMLISILPSLIWTPDSKKSYSMSTHSLAKSSASANKARGWIERTKESVISTTMWLYVLIPSIYRTLLLFFLASCVWSPFMYYFTDFIAETVYHGSPSHESNASSWNEYEEGIETGSLILSLMQFVTMISSMFLPFLMTHVGIKKIMFLGFLIATVCFLMAPLKAIQTVTWCAVIYSIVGFFNASQLTIYFALIGEAVTKQENGVAIGIMNVVMVIGQMISNLLASSLMEYTENVSLGIVIGGIFGIISLLVIPFLKIAYYTPDKPAIPVTQLQDSNELERNSSENSGVKIPTHHMSAFYSSLNSRIGTNEHIDGNHNGEEDNSHSRNIVEYSSNSDSNSDPSASTPLLNESLYGGNCIHKNYVFGDMNVTKFQLKFRRRGANQENNGAMKNHALDSSVSENCKDCIKESRPVSPDGPEDTDTENIADSTNHLANTLSDRFVEEHSISSIDDDPEPDEDDNQNLINGPPGCD